MSTPLPVKLALLNARLPMVSLPPSASVAVGDTVTAAVLARRSALPRVSVPPVMLTVVAADVPFSATAPLLVSVPVPRLPSTVPLARL